MIYTKPAFGIGQVQRAGVWSRLPVPPPPPAPLWINGALLFRITKGVENNEKARLVAGLSLFLYYLNYTGWGITSMPIILSSMWPVCRRLRGYGRFRGLTSFWSARRCVAGRERLDQSFRLRLHSGLRQSGSAFGAAFDAGTKVPAYPINWVWPGSEAALPHLRSEMWGTRLVSAESQDSIVGPNVALDCAGDHPDGRDHGGESIAETVPFMAGARSIIHRYVKEQIGVCLHFHSWGEPGKSKRRNLVFVVQKAKGVDLHRSKPDCGRVSELRGSLDGPQAHHVRGSMSVLSRPIAEDTQHAVEIHDHEIGSEFWSVVRLYSFDERATLRRLSESGAILEAFLSKAVFVL